MSYILDALKRADAERERGAVPGLQSRHAAAPAAKSGRSVQNGVWLAAAALALGGTAAGLWLWQAPSGTGRLAAVAPAVATPPPLALATPAPPPLLPMPAPPTVATLPRAVASAPPVVNRVAPKSAPRPAPATSAVTLQPPPRPDPVAKAALGQPAPPAVQMLSQLPEDLRRQIPPLVITGSVYSSNPDKRLLLVNNQVLAQGSLAAPGVTLEQIQAKSSVFSFQGTRFRVAH